MRDRNVWNRERATNGNGSHRGVEQIGGGLATFQ